VPPNIQRFLPLIVVAFLVIFVLPSILHKSSSKGPTAKTLSAETIGALGLVDKAEVAFKARHAGYTSHVADLLATAPALGADLADGIAVDLDVSTDAKTYYAQVTSTALSMVRSRTGVKQIANGCVVVKSGSGVACPVKPAAKTTTTTGATTTTGS
jgi:hypothetical protein